MFDDNIYYTTAGIYGVKIQTHVNNEFNILFKRQFNTLMSIEMPEEAKAFYENLDENSKRNVKLKLYRNCKSVNPFLTAF